MTGKHLLHKVEVQVASSQSKTGELRLNMDEHLEHRSLALPAWVCLRRNLPQSHSAVVGVNLGRVPEEGERGVEGMEGGGEVSATEPRDWEKGGESERGPLRGPSCAVVLGETAIPRKLAPK